MYEEFSTEHLYLNHEYDSNSIGDDTDSCNKQFFVWSQQFWPFIDDGCEESFHCTELNEITLDEDIISIVLEVPTWLSMPSMMIIKKKSIAHIGENGNFNVADG